MLRMERHRTGPGCDEGSRRMRRRDDNLLAVRNHLVNIQRNISCSRREIKQHDIEPAPLHFLEEIAKHFAQHRAAPYNRTIVFHEKAHRHHFDAEPFNRDHHVVLHDRAVFNPHHIRDAEAIDIGIDESDPLAQPGQSSRQINRDGRLADAALAAGHGDEFYA